LNKIIQKEIGKANENEDTERKETEQTETKRNTTKIENRERKEKLLHFIFIIIIGFGFHLHSPSELHLLRENRPPLPHLDPVFFNGPWTQSSCLVAALKTHRFLLRHWFFF